MMISIAAERITGSPIIYRVESIHFNPKCVGGVPLT